MISIIQEGVLGNAIDPSYISKSGKKTPSICHDEKWRIDLLLYAKVE